MVRSKATSAHVLTAIEVDYENVDRVRRADKDEFKAEEGFSLTYLPFIARAVVDAIREFPQVNASVGDDELIVHHYVNLGIAVDLDFEGLMVPVVHDADGKRLRAIAREIADLAARARNKKLGPDDISGGTFTITNPGPYGTFITAADHQPAPGRHPVHRRREEAAGGRRAARRQRRHRHPPGRQPGPGLGPPRLRRRLRRGVPAAGQGDPRDPGLGPGAVR